MCMFPEKKKTKIMCVVCIMNHMCSHENNTHLHNIVGSYAEVGKLIFNLVNAIP